jgi:uncharacterized Zn finger protein
MSEDWVEARDKSVLDTIYYCETCNFVLERGDTDVSRHKNELPNHKMRRVMILRCSHCGNVVTDSHAEYSPERNQFWCKSCLFDKEARREFHEHPEISARTPDSRR